MCNCISGLMGIKYTVDSGIEDSEAVELSSPFVALIETTRFVLSGARSDKP